MRRMAVRGRLEEEGSGGLGVCYPLIRAEAYGDCGWDIPMVPSEERCEVEEGSRRV